MPIKLLVTSVGDDGPPDEYVFDQATVTIGRDGANLLTLPDPMRVVSKHHAEIRDTGTAFHLVDLGSKNFTYLNGSRLASGEPATIQPGDAFTIGDFELRFFPEQPATPDYDRTVFAAAFVNPFEEPAEQLATVLGDLRRVFATETGSHREDALRDALRAAMLGGGDAPGRIVAEALGGPPSSIGAPPYTPPAAPAAPPFAPPPAAPDVPPSPYAPPPAFSPPEYPAPQYPAADPPATFDTPPPPPPPAGLPPIALPPSDAPPAPAGLPPIALPPSDPTVPTPPPYTPPSPPPAAPPSGPPPYTSAPPAAHGAVGGRTDKVLGVLAESVTKLIGIPRRFRHEFIGQTMTHTQDVAFLYENAPGDLKDLLLDPSVAPSDLDQRLNAIRDATEETVVHQLAMLDGYKASVQDGAQRLLGEVNPEPIEEEVEASNPMYKVPQLRATAVIERLKETHRELGGEDWSVAERRAFRPAFIKAYLARMSRRRS